MNYDEIVANWQNKKIESKADLIAAIENFRILFAYNSNVIENPQTKYHTTREIFDEGRVSSYTGDLRTLYEIENQKKTFDFIADSIIAKIPLSDELIRKVQKKLMYGCYTQERYDKGERPGSYKKHEYVVGDEIGVLPEDVLNEIEELCNEVNNLKKTDFDSILTAAAYFHLSFESIHPFADGNGRTGRMLMNYYLMTHGVPPTIIYNEDKEAYYMGLTVFDKTGKIDGFKKFLMEQTIKTWSKKKPYHLNLQ